jgi:hypothetical protein
MAIAVLAVVAVIGVRLHQVFHKFSVEDQIHDSFFPVAMALYDYEDAHGSPATNLTQLVPAYLPQIPSSRLADSVEYSVIDGGKAWQLSIHNRALSPPRLYCCRSSHQFTAEEKQRILIQYHSWTVLRD